MAQETLTVQKAARSGVTPSYQSVTSADGFRFKNDGHTAMWVEEKNAAPVTIGIVPTVQVDGQTPAAKSVVVSGSAKSVLGPWPPELYNDADGYANFTITADEASAIVVMSVR